jgi:hypothetical protein
VTSLPTAGIHALQHLVALESLLRAQGERNWIRGVSAAKQALEDGDLAGAKSIYRTMVRAKAGFGDYNIFDEDFDTRVSLNAQLDRLRDGLWTLLGE